MTLVRTVTVTRQTRDRLQAALDARSLAFPLKPEAYEAIREVVSGFDRAQVSEQDVSDDGLAA